MVATTISVPKTTSITVCIIMDTKNHHMAWVEDTKEMMAAIIKVLTPTIIIAMCKGITKMIRNPCNLEESQAIMAIV